LATSKDPKNGPLISEAEKLGCGWFAGAEQDIVERHIQLCAREKADAVIRVTCDSPIFDIGCTSVFVKSLKNPSVIIICFKYDDDTGHPFRAHIAFALEETHKHYRGAGITVYIKETVKIQNAGYRDRCGLVPARYRLTIDEAVDIEMIGRIYDALIKESRLTCTSLHLAG